MSDRRPPVLGFAAPSGTGKTSLLTKLIPILKDQGLRIGIIKHSHHDFEIDQPGKDSYRLRKAGASPVMLVSPYRCALISELPADREINLADQLAAFPYDELDLILVEGFRHEIFPKIELHRPSLGKPLLYPDDHAIIAIASDQALSTPAALPCLDLNNPHAIADFILHTFLSSHLVTDICYPKKTALLSVEQAWTEIRQAIAPIAEPEIIDLPQALGRILAQNVQSPIDIPPQRNAAMDGYAFASADINTLQAFDLQVVGTAWAGQPYLQPVASGQCVRIFTGAVVPDFADSVIAQEQVIVNGDMVTFPKDCPPYKNIRAAGSDVECHQILIAAPKKLNACDLSLLAAAGVAKISVKRKIKIGFFSTGDELTAIGEPLAYGQIYDSNRYLLAALLSDSNHIVNDLGLVGDDRQQLEQILLTASRQHDVLLSSGGASVGDADFVGETLEKCGQVNFWKLAIKPGKPLAFGKINDCWFFGLPGNPVAVLVTYHKFVKPGLAQLAGCPHADALQLQARCDSPLRKSPGRQEYQRGILSQSADGELVVKLAGQQDSHQLKVASIANCFIVLDADCAGVAPGESVTVEPFDILI